MRNTPNYNLPQFDGTDKFDKDVLNDAYLKLDEAINDLQETFNLGAGDAGLLSKEVVEARKGKAKLVDKITELEDSDKGLQDQIDTWNDFKANGGEIGGNFRITDNTSKPIFTKRYTISNNDVWLRHNVTNNGGYANIVRFAEDSDEGTLNQVGYQLKKNGFGDNLGELSPLTTDTTTLGTSSVKWKDIYLSGFSKSTNGYTKLPNGMILQWGNLTTSFVNGIVDQSVTFGIAFPTACCSIAVSCTQLNSAYEHDIIANCGRVTNSSFKVTARHITQQGNWGSNFSYLAIGY